MSSYSKERIELPDDLHEVDTELVEKFQEALGTDSENPNILGVINLYNESDGATRGVINEVFVHLCGWQLTTLAKTDVELLG